MCYTRKDRDDLEKEARRVTERRLMEEEARHWPEEHHRRRAKEKKPLTEISQGGSRYRQLRQ